MERSAQKKMVTLSSIVGSIASNISGSVARWVTGAAGPIGRFPRIRCRIGRRDIPQDGVAVPPGTLTKSRFKFAHERVTIFEGTVRHDNLLVRVDVLVKRGRQVELIELREWILPLGA